MATRGRGQTSICWTVIIWWSLEFSINLPFASIGTFCFPLVNSVFWSTDRPCRQTEEFYRQAGMTWEERGCFWRAGRRTKTPWAQIWNVHPVKSPTGFKASKNKKTNVARRPLAAEREPCRASWQTSCSSHRQEKQFRKWRRKKKKNKSDAEVTGLMGNEGGVKWHAVKASTCKVLRFVCRHRCCLRNFVHQPYETKTGGEKPTDGEKKTKKKDQIEFVRLFSPLWLLHLP